GNRQFRITYSGGSGNDIVLTTLTSATATAITSAPNPTILGQPVTFSATVTAMSGVGTPTGTVTFKEGSTVLGSAPLSGNQASLVVSTLTPGSHAVVATYNGDGSYDPSSTDAPANQRVLPLPTTSITVASNLSLPNFGQTITFTAMVKVETGTGTPTGTVTFLDRGTTLGSASLGSDGKATFSISTLSLGLHSITAV